jgi:predicted ATPase/DNA-binding SARP family transcriptional activator
VTADLLDVRVLGSIAIASGDGTVLVDRPLERAFFVRLVLARGTPVPDERLAADLWGDVELHRAPQRLRVVASRLRSSLGEHAAAVGRSPAGYRAAAGPSDLLAAEDAASRMHAAARSADRTGVRDAAVAALACWRGAALADLRGVPYAQAEGERLDAWWLELTVHRLRAELELGAGEELVVELTGLAGEHPLHEPIGGMLAHALYRAGRQADALDRLARLRRALADELGVDPSPDTAELELRLLRQDPALLAPRPPAASIDTRQAVQPLPAPRSSFVGRTADLAALLGTVAAPGIVTLVGGPGSGKSRLAIEAARAVADRAVRVVELAPLHHDDVVPAVADTAGVEIGAGDPLPAAAAALDGSLLLLDNAEHVIDEVSAAVRALRLAAPALTVLVTSQRPLLLSGETQVRVGPLAPSAAAALFVERAAPDARPDPAEVATICAAVDHLPLGVELAAGLTRALTVTQVARRITDRIRLLVGGRRDTGGRHTSLRAALDWSHELLGEPERAVLRRLGVFAGGCDLDAAERVTSAGDVQVGDIAPALTDLVDRSLVGVVAGGDGQRFVLLETVRDYALGRLAAAGEADAARARHLTWCIDHVTRLAEVDEFASADTVAAAFAEWPNVLEALETAPGTARAAGALRLANAMHSPWLVRGRFRAARHHFAALVDAPGAGAAERAQAMSNHGFHALMAGVTGEAIAMLAAASELAAGSGDDELVLDVRYHHGILTTQLGKLAESIATLRAGRELARARGDRREWTFADALGTALLFAGETEEALACYRASVAHDRELHDEHGLARGLTNQANAELDAGRVAEALQLADESDVFALRLDDSQVPPLNELVRAAAARAEGRLADAEEHCRAAVAYSEGAASMAHIDLADALVATGRLEEAAGLLEFVYSQSSEGELAWLAARAVSCALAVASGDGEAREMVERTVAQHMAAGFGWRRYTDRLREVAAALQP